MLLTVREPCRDLLLQLVTLFLGSVKKDSPMKKLE